LSAVQLSEAGTGLPPGPREAVLPATVRFGRDPLGVLADCQRIYGDVFTLTPLWPRRERMVLRGTVLVPHRSVPVLVPTALAFSPAQAG
jgi:hypothetical protein